MKLSDLNNIPTTSVLKVSDLENFFNVELDKNHNYVFNLNETLYINADKSSLKQHVCDYDSHWPLLSYTLYGTTRLAWLLMKLNNVDAKHVFDVQPAGTTIYYLEQNQAESILADIHNI